MEEVKKHKKKNDAWMVLRGKVHLFCSSLVPGYPTQAIGY
jgi:cytochrome b involved in lipid metabolism